MTHDPVCPLDDMPTFDCTVCTAIAAARREELDKFNSVWRANLPRVEARNWMDGYRAATNGRPVPEWVTRGSVPMRRG